MQKPRRRRGSPDIPARYTLCPTTFELELAFQERSTPCCIEVTPLPLSVFFTISQSPSISKTLQVVIVSRIIAERQANPVSCAATATHPAQCSPKIQTSIVVRFLPNFRANLRASYLATLRRSRVDARIIASLRHRWRGDSAIRTAENLAELAGQRVLSR